MPFLWRRSTLVFTFSNQMLNGNASVTARTGSLSGNPTFQGSTMTVHLTGVADGQTLTITLSNLTDVFVQPMPATSVSSGRGLSSR